MPAWLCEGKNHHHLRNLRMALKELLFIMAPYLSRPCVCSRSAAGCVPATMYGGGDRPGRAVQLQTQLWSTCESAEYVCKKNKRGFLWKLLRLGGWRDSIWERLHLCSFSAKSHGLLFGILPPNKPEKLYSHSKRKRVSQAFSGFLPGPQTPNNTQEEPAPGHVLGHSLRINLGWLWHRNPGLGSFME